MIKILRNIKNVLVKKTLEIQNILFNTFHLNMAYIVQEIYVCLVLCYVLFIYFVHP